MWYNRHKGIFYMCMKGKNYKPDDIIREGDLIKIVVPHMFVRCGYPLTYQESRDRIDKKYNPAIYEFLKTIDAIDDEEKDELKELGLSIRYGEHSEEIRLIKHMLARRNMRKEKFGGKERRIYTEHNEKFEGRLCRVVRVYFKRTGTYYPPEGGYDSYTGESDYEPGGVMGGKTHKILELEDVDGSYMYSGLSSIVIRFSNQTGTHIEARNVSKVHFDNRWEVCNNCDASKNYHKDKTYYSPTRRLSYKNFTQYELENWKPLCSLKDMEKCKYTLELTVIGGKSHER